MDAAARPVGFLWMSRPFIRLTPLPPFARCIEGRVIRRIRWSGLGLECGEFPRPRLVSIPGSAPNGRPGGHGRGNRRGEKCRASGAAMWWAASQEMSPPPSGGSEDPSEDPGAGKGTPPGGTEVPPPRIPDHTLLYPIGRGSFGEVWLARNAMGTLRAVKIVRRRDFGEDHPFDREFKGIQQFEPVSRGHPGLVDILQVGRKEAEGYFYHVMELGDPASGPLPGVGSGNRDGQAERVSAEVESGVGCSIPGGYVPRTLRRELKARGRLPLPECLRVGLALAGGLEHLHRHGLVHRDVKPSNIIFGDGQPKLADIGLVAPVDEARSLVGTAGYIPPEGPGTPGGDVYSLGKVLYEAAFGKDRQEFPQLPPDLGQLPDHGRLLELNAILLKACESDPARRYRSAGALAADLERVRDGRPVRGRWPSPKAPALVAGLLALLWLAWPARSPVPPPSRARPAGDRASVFVLPFRGEPPGPVADDLRGRITDAFLDGLALMEGVRVGPHRAGWNIPTRRRCGGRWRRPTSCGTS
ncbi:MAG: serine/threonine-protein kinase [Verrucomicrobiota bacterium]